jgi:uncharacterized protein (TIGR02996 family)
MTAEEDALIRAILAAPNDTALRLVYADWLEEQGDPRSEYLRLLAADRDGEGADQEALLARVESLQAAIDPSWVALMMRGRVSQTQPTGPKGNKAKRSRRDRLEGDVGIFLQKYARRGCNDRSYSREVEARVQRMKPEELDRLMRGEEEAPATGS